MFTLITLNFDATWTKLYKFCTFCSLENVHVWFSGEVWMEVGQGCVWWWWGGGGNPWTPGARHTIMPSPLILWPLPTPDSHGSRCFCAVFRDVATPDEATYKSSDIDTQQQPSHPCPTQVCVCFMELQQKTPSVLSSLSGE